MEWAAAWAYGPRWKATVRWSTVPGAFATFFTRTRWGAQRRVTRWIRDKNTPLPREDYTVVWDGRTFVKGDSR